MGKGLQLNSHMIHILHVCHHDLQQTPNQPEQTNTLNLHKILLHGVFLRHQPWTPNTPPKKNSWKKQGWILKIWAGSLLLHWEPSPLNEAPNGKTVVDTMRSLGLPGRAFLGATCGTQSNSEPSKRALLTTRKEDDLRIQVSTRLSKASKTRTQTKSPNDVKHKPKPKPLRKTKGNQTKGTNVLETRPTAVLISFQSWSFLDGEHAYTKPMYYVIQLWIRFRYLNLNNNGNIIQSQWSVDFHSSKGKVVNIPEGNNTTRKQQLELRELDIGTATWYIEFSIYPSAQTKHQTKERAPWVRLPLLRPSSWPPGVGLGKRGSTGVLRVKVRRTNSAASLVQRTHARG